MLRSSRYTLMLWALRDLQRHPAGALLTAAALASLTFVLATALLLPRALSQTAASALQHAPDLVVRRVTTGGWTPMPERAAVAAARQVIGIVRAQPRIWGTAGTVVGPVTVWALSAGDGPTEPHNGLPDRIAPGEAWIGAGLADHCRDDRLRLEAADGLTVTVAGMLERRSALVSHDLVLLTPTDARRVLGLAAGQVSDLALSVFHPDEADALRSELAASFPWPVRVTTRREAMGQYQATLARRGGLFTLVCIPAVLALGLIVAGAVQQRLGRSGEVGLLRALGWTTTDVIRLQLWRALWLGLPAVVCGAVLAAGIVFWPGIEWPGALLLGWNRSPPPLYLNTAGAGFWLLEIALVVLVPYLAAVLAAAVKGAATAPRDLMQGGWR